MTFDAATGFLSEPAPPGDAQSLARLIERQGPLPPYAAVLLLDGVAEALRNAPGSPVSGLTISLEASGRVRLGPPLGVPPTRTGTPATTPLAFTAPEQFAGRPGTPAGDEYALGALGFYALAGHPPFEGPTAEDFARQHEADGVPDLLTLRKEVPGELAMMLYVALAKHPTDRHGSPDAFLLALGTVPMSRDQRAAAEQQLAQFASGKWTPHPAAPPAVVKRRPGVEGAESSGPRAKVKPAPPSLREMQRRPANRLKQGLVAIAIAGAGLYGAIHLMEPDEPEGRYRAPGVGRAGATAVAQAVAPTPTDSVPVAIDEDPPLVRGMNAFETGRFKEAIPLLKRASEIDPEDPTPHGFLACVYRMQARNAEADRELALTNGQHGAWDRCSGRRR